MAFSIGTITNVMREDCIDSEDFCNNNIVNSGIKKLPPKKKAFSDFELQATHEEDHNDADGIRSYSTPESNKASSVQLECEAFLSEKHQCLNDKKFSFLTTGTSKIKILNKHSGNLFHQMTLRLPKERILKKRIDLQPKKLFEEKEVIGQEDGSKFSINAAELNVESIRQRKHECEVTAFSFQCSSASSDPLLILPRSTASIDSKGYIFHSNDEDFRLMTMLQYIKSCGAMDIHWIFMKRNVKIFFCLRSRSLIPGRNVNIKKNGGKRMNTVHYGFLGTNETQYCKKEDKKVSGTEKRTGNTHFIESKIYSAHEDEDYNTSAATENDSFAIGTEDSDDIKIAFTHGNGYLTKTSDDLDSGCSSNTTPGNEDNGRHDDTEDCIYGMHSFNNIKSNVIFILNGENGDNSYSDESALLSSGIIRLAPNENKIFIASKQIDDSSVVGDKDSPETYEAKKSKKSVFSTISVPYGQNRSAVYLNHFINSTSVMLAPNEGKKISITTKGSDSAENIFTVFNEEYCYFPENSYIIDAIVNDDNNVNIASYDYTECEYLENNTTEVFSDKMKKNLGIEVDVSIIITPDTDYSNSEYKSFTKNCTTKHKSTENHDSLQEQITEINYHVLDLSSFKKYIQDNSVKAWPFQIINSNLGGLAAKISEINGEITYVLEINRSVGNKVNSNVTISKTTNKKNPMSMKIESNLKSYFTQLFEASQDDPSDRGAAMEKRNKQCFSTDVQILPSGFQEKTLQNITNTNNYNDVSQFSEATSGEAFFVYNFKVKEEKILIPLTTECVRNMLLAVTDNVNKYTANSNAKEFYQPCDLHGKQKFFAQENVLEKQISCSLWETLSNLECPFNWSPDIEVLGVSNGRMQEDLIQYLTDGCIVTFLQFVSHIDSVALCYPLSVCKYCKSICITVSNLKEKEKDFSRSKTNILREIVIHLVLAYEKACEDNLIDALADLSHCYSLLGNPQFIPAGMQVDFKDMHITTAKGIEHYMKIKERRAHAKNKVHRQHALQTSFDNDISFWNSDKHLSDQQNKKNKSRNVSTQCQRRINLGDTNHLLSLIDCTLHSEQPKVIVPSKNYLERTNRNKVESKVAYESPLLAEEVGNQNPENKQVKVTSGNNVLWYMPYNSYNMAASNIAEPKWRCCYPEIKSKEMNCSNQRTLNSHVVRKPKVSSEDIECDSNDINQNMCSPCLVSHLTSDDVLDNNSEETEAGYATQELSFSFDDTEEPCKTTCNEEERKKALIYAVTAAVAHVAYFCENYQGSYVAAEVCKYWYSQLGKTGMATLLAVKGSVFLEYGMMGNKLALPYLKKALVLDPNYWEWNLLCGKVIGRLHKWLKRNNAAPEAEELQLLEKAAELNPNDASCLVHLANVYRSLANFQYMAQLEIEATKEISKNVGQNAEQNQKKSLSTIITSYAMDYNKRGYNPQNIPVFSHINKPPDQQQKDYLHLARQLYLKALELEQNCPYNNARCAKGLWSMPYPYKEKYLAQKAILHALTLAPSDTLVNHYAGMFYETAGDKKNALECYKRATSDAHFNYHAERSYINLKLKTGPAGYTPVVFLDHLLYKYPSPCFVVQTLCFKGYYLYVVEKKILLAIRNITAAIIMEPTHSCVKAFQPGTCFGRRIPAVNMYELLKEMLHSYWQSPQRIFNEEYWNSVLEAARRLTNEYTENNQEKASAKAKNEESLLIFNEM